MQRTASDVPVEPRYDFSFAWDSSYGHVVELVERLSLQRGFVIDLGCGVSPIAGPLRDRGYGYIGADIDPVSLKQLTDSGIESHELDLAQTEQLAAEIPRLAEGRPIAAVLLLDVIEHLTHTRDFLLALRKALEALGRPPLLVSVPNVAHVDVAAKLVFGRWDYRPTGLLDCSHVKFFTAQRLHSELAWCGLLELAAHDVTRRASDQHFPADHPALAWSSPIALAIRRWRDQADEHGQTVQFVRAFMCGNVEQTGQAQETADEPAPADAMALAVVVRTQGRRSAHLRDALTCLAAQTYDRFEVLLMVHADDAEPAVSSVQALVDDFDPTFSARIRVIHVSGGRRARPLNEALARARADYVAFLDDDDIVMADWVESFVDAGGGGVVVRSGVAIRRVSAADSQHCHPYVVESPLIFRYKLDFDRVTHLWENETPICAFAVPRSLIEAIGARFDEQLPVLEDWDFLMRCVSCARVRDTRKVTSIYQMWSNGESSASLHKAELWQATQRVLHDRMNQHPLVLPPGSVEQLVDMCERLPEIDNLREQLEAVRHEAASLRNEARRDEQAVAEAAAATGELERLRHAYHTTINSRRWRMLGPPARIVATIRSILRAAVRFARGR